MYVHYKKDIYVTSKKGALQNNLDFQYLHLEILRLYQKLVKYYSPDEFKMIENHAWDLGFKMVSCSPLTRSSYHADEHFDMLRKANA